MAQKKQNIIKFFVDPIGNTFSMWFDDPKKEYSCEMNKQEDILSLSKNNKVIGFEKINFLPKEFIKSLALINQNKIQGELLMLR